MAGARGARGLEGLIWLVRVSAGVAGFAGASQAYASGLGPLAVTLAAFGAFGLSYALLLAGIRRFGRLLERAADADFPIPAPPAASQAAPSVPPRLVRTRRRNGPRRRLMSPEGPPSRPE